jgi:hypothetical protein
MSKVFGEDTNGNSQAIKTDTSGNLKVNIAAGSSSGTQYADGDASATTGTLMLGATSGNQAQSLLVDSNGRLSVDINSGGGGGTQYADGDGSATTGTLMLGATSGNQAQSLLVDSNGRLSINVLTCETITPGTGATNLGKAIQSAQGATDTGVAALVVRNDTLADLAGADHDYTALQVNASGALYTSLATALPSGTNSIGKLTENDGVDIGDVDVKSIVPGTGATNLGKAQDTAHSDGDVGVMTLGVRQDAQADFGADGDYVPLSINADGELRVTTGGGGGGTQYAVDASSAHTGTGTLMLGVGTSNQAEYLSVTATNELKVKDGALSNTSESSNLLSGSISQGANATIDITLPDFNNFVIYLKATLSATDGGGITTSSIFQVSYDGTNFLKSTSNLSDYFYSHDSNLPTTTWSMPQSDVAGGSSAQRDFVLSAFSNTSRYSNALGATETILKPLFKKIKLTIQSAVSGGSITVDSITATSYGK